MWPSPNSHPSTKITQYIASLGGGLFIITILFENVIFNHVLLIGIFKSAYDNVRRWMPQDLTDDKPTLVQVMAWCHQATTHYLNQCWPRSPTPYGVTRPQWVKVHNVYFKNVPGFVDIRFTSRPKLMRKIKSTSKTPLLIKSVVF